MRQNENERAEQRNGEKEQVRKRARNGVKRGKSIADDDERALKG